MSYDDFFTLLRARRSCRSFVAEEPLSNEALRRIIDAGRQAPSPLNLQPWSFIVITSCELKKQLRQAGEKAKQQVLDQGGPGWVGGFSTDFMEEAPLLIALLSEPEKGGLGAYFNQPAGSLQAVSACMQNMMLAATSLGLGSLWFTFFDPFEVRSLLNIPCTHDIAGLLYIGRAGGEVPFSKRRPPRIYAERFGVDGDFF
ncbi:MAG: nitroreductase family protein [Deltaproteobacteria bacterium]|nr:nitroreductase family protein [Deltaproteobacteria bacterium]